MGEPRLDSAIATEIINLAKPLGNNRGVYSSVIYFTDKDSSIEIIRAVLTSSTTMDTSSQVSTKSLPGMECISFILTALS